MTLSGLPPKHLGQISFSSCCIWYIIGMWKTVLTLADEAIHLCQCDLIVVEAAVFDKAPELHASHGEGVVRALLIAQLAVEVVDLAQAADVSSNHIQHLHTDTQSKSALNHSYSRLLIRWVITYNTYKQTHRASQP